MTNEIEKQFFNTFGIEPKTIIEPRYSLNTDVLKNLIELSGRYHIYNQVRTLFEE